MSWILGGGYCFILWLVFAKLRLIRLSLPIAVVSASVGPGLIVALLFCAQYFHPYTNEAIVLSRVVPIAAQVTQRGRVVDVPVKPNTPLAAGDVLFRIDPTPYQNTIAQLTSALDQAKQNAKYAQESVKLSQASLDRATSSMDYATKTRNRQQELMDQDAGSQQNLDTAINAFNEADAALSAANVNLSQARLAVETAMLKVDQTETQLANAQYDLQQTTVVAPSGGYVTNVQLREGAMVGAVSGAVMSFVLESDPDEMGVVVAAFTQKNFLRIQPGQYCEVALHSYPGQIFPARVVNAIDVSGDGQWTASGTLPTTLAGGRPTSFAVRVRIDEAEGLRIPGGTRAHVAVYTQDVQIAAIPIMFVIRAQSWLHYLI